jgi:prevent-host-death family protein
MPTLPIRQARDHISEQVDRARYGGEATILSRYGAPAAAAISFEEYERLTHATEEAASYDLPPEIMAQVEEDRRHSSATPRPRRAARARSHG